METKDLIEYGFKRVIEELQVIQGLQKNNAGTLNAINTECKAMRAELKKIENDAFSLNRFISTIDAATERIKSTAFITEQNVIRILDILKEGGTDGKENPEDADN